MWDRFLIRKGIREACLSNAKALCFNVSTCRDPGTTSSRACLDAGDPDGVWPAEALRDEVQQEREALQGLCIRGGERPE